MNPIVLIVALIVVAVRLTIGPGLDLRDTYKDLAHLYVGGLFGAWLVSRSLCRRLHGSEVCRATAGRFLRLAAALTLVEVACGFFGKATGVSVFEFVQRLFS
jgi:hypothetical protein